MRSITMFTMSTLLQNHVLKHKNWVKNLDSKIKSINFALAFEGEELQRQFGRESKSTVAGGQELKTANFLTKICRSQKKALTLYPLFGTSRNGRPE